MMQPIRCRCFIALAALLTLFCGKALGFAPNDYRRKTTITPASRPATIRAKIIPKKSYDGRNRWKNRSHRQKSSRLTSTYVEARHISNRFKSIQGIISVAAVSFKKCRKWLRSSTKAKRLIVGIILGAIIIFGPAFSPAHAASSVGSTTAFPAQSRALGQFNFLPSKAELEFSFRLVYAACSAALVGLERSCADRPAGLRTCCLVGLGACIYTISSVHGFLPHSALGYAPGSPMLEGVKCDPSRMAANIASGVGFIGAGAIHKSKTYGKGTEIQNFTAGLTTAAAIWISAAIGVASAVGLYYVSAVSTLATVLILRYARLPHSDDEPGFSWSARPLEEVEESKETFEAPKSSGLFGHTPQSSKVIHDALRQYRNDLAHVTKAPDNSTTWD